MNKPNFDKNQTYYKQPRHYTGNKLFFSYYFFSSHIVYWLHKPVIDKKKNQQD